MERNKLEVMEDRVLDLIPLSTSSFILSGNRLTFDTYVLKINSMKNIIYLDLSLQHLNIDPFLHKHQEHLSGIKSSYSVIGNNDNTNHLDMDFTKDDESEMLNDYKVGLLTYKYSYVTNTGDLFHKPKSESFVSTDYNRSLQGIENCTCQQNCTSDMNCICPPPNLRTLKWRQSFFYAHLYAVQFCQPISLRKIDILNLIETWIRPVYGLEKLTDLNLAENICQNMSSYFFDNFYSILTLNISYNFLGPVLDPARRDSGMQFKNLSSLTGLDLSETRIRALSADIFQTLKGLQYLNVSKNMLKTWNCTLNATCLTLIDLSNNKLETLPKAFRSYLDYLSSLGPELTCNRTGPVTADLSGNSIQCNCDNRPFLRWLSKTTVYIPFYPTDECHQDGQRLQLRNNSNGISDFVDRLDSVCFPYAFIYVSIGIFFTSIGLCIVVYRYRWKLRHIYYNSRRRHRHQGYDRLFEHDAFISYPRTEGSFIKNKLVPALEDEHGLRVWVADRDSSAGVSIAENLTHAIYASRKSVLILSRSYFDESWCNYEMNIARIESIESKRKLMIIVRYEDIAAKDIPLDYLRLLKTVPSIEYPKHPQHLDTFWAALAAAIQTE